MSSTAVDGRTREGIRHPNRLSFLQLRLVHPMVRFPVPQHLKALPSLARLEP